MLKLHKSRAMFQVKMSGRQEVDIYSAHGTWSIRLGARSHGTFPGRVPEGCEPHAARVLCTPGVSNNSDTQFRQHAFLAPTVPSHTWLSNKSELQHRHHVQRPAPKLEMSHWTCFAYDYVTKEWSHHRKAATARMWLLSITLPLLSRGHSHFWRALVTRECKTLKHKHAEQLTHKRRNHSKPSG